MSEREMVTRAIDYRTLSHSPMVVFHLVYILTYHGVVYSFTLPNSSMCCCKVVVWLDDWTLVMFVR